MEISKPRITLRKSIEDLGFGRKNKRLKLVAIETMLKLLAGHEKSMKIKKHTISRYAAGLLGHYRGIFEKPKSKITNFEKLDNFIKVFVETLFISNGKLKNIDLFAKIFGINILQERVSIDRVKANPSPEILLKYSIQKRPISNFKTAQNLEQLKKMTSSDIKLLLTPRGRFNPKLSSLNEIRAMHHAIILTKKFAKTTDASKRLALSTLIEQLQKTNKLNEELYKNIRNVVKK